MALGLSIFLIIMSVTMILLVLLHKGKGAGLSDLFGGGISSNYGGSSVVERNLDRITIVVGGLWFAGVVAISGIAFFAFAYLLAVDYGFSRAGAPSLITAVLIGICLGFLPHNLSPAKIFMGDSGSMLLGLLLSVSAITLTGQVDPNAISAEKLGPTLLPLLLPFAVLAIPFLDLVLAVSRRIKAGKSPFAPDNLHLHHRLLSAGNTTGQTVLIVYLWTATIAFPVTVLAFAPWWIAVLTALFFALLSAVVMKYRKKVVA